MSKFGWHKDPFIPGQPTHTKFLMSIGHNFQKPLPEAVSLEYLFPLSEIRDR